MWHSFTSIAKVLCRIVSHTVKVSWKASKTDRTGRHINVQHPRQPAMQRDSLQNGKRPSEFQSTIPNKLVGATILRYTVKRCKIHVG